jgi:L-iditol 2-dehydrogenase
LFILSLTPLPETTQTALFYAPRDVRLESLPCPKPVAGELLLRMGVALTCGTDLKCFKRDHPVLLGEKRPAPFGHEGAGTVLAVGEGVTHFKVGDRVVAANSAPCGTCFYCKAAQENLCEQLHLLNGTYAETLILPASIVSKNTYLLPEALSFEVAAFTEPLAVSWRGVEACQLTAGQHVAIMGLGPIGQLMVKCAKLQGLHVTALARSPHKLALAQSFGGADTVISIAEGFDAEAIKQDASPEGRGFDAVIEAIGLPETWEKAVTLVRRGGLVNWFAGCAGGSQVTLSTRRLHYDDIRLVSPFHHTPTHVAQAFEWLANGSVDPRPLISASLPLSDLSQAFDLMEKGEALKVAIYP